MSEMKDTVDNELATVGIDLGNEWYAYHKKLRTGKSEVYLWAKIDNAIVRTGLWLREILGYDVVKEDNDGEQHIVESQPFYKLLLTTGALERMPIRGYVVQETGVISERTINLMEQKRVPAKTLVIVEVEDAKEEDGVGAQVVSDPRCVEEGATADEYIALWRPERNGRPTEGSD